MWLYVGSLTCLLIASAFKNDADAILSTLYWFELQTGPAVNALKSMYIPLIILGCLLAFPKAISGMLSRNAPRTFLFLFSFCYAISISSALYFDSGESFRIALSFIIFILSTFSVCGAIDRFGPRRCFRLTLVAFTAFSCILIVTNIIDYVRGLGYVPGNPRMFGSASHPNFFGVQLALAGIALLTVFFSAGSYLIKCGVASLIALDALLLVATGSRTGMLMLASGSALLLWVQLGGRAWVGMLSISIAIAVAFILISAVQLDQYSDVFNRGGETDTRTAAWAAMVELISDSPILGYGGPIGTSENSFLRGWVAYGVGYTFIAVGTFTSLMVLGVFRSVRHDPTFSNVSGFCMALLIGSNLEGFMVDGFSPGWLVGVILMSMIGTERRHACRAAVGSGRPKQGIIAHSR